jgi:hypothetical protein
MLGVGMLFGFGLATLSVRIEIQVDYDSGAVREVVSLGPFRVREARQVHGFFGSIRMPNGETALTGAESWHVALFFRNNSNRSPLLEAGLVLNDISRLEQLPWNKSTPGLSAVKQQFLESLAKHGVHAASEVARASEQRILSASEDRH